MTATARWFVLLTLVASLRTAKAEPAARQVEGTATLRTLRGATNHAERTLHYWVGAAPPVWRIVVRWREGERERFCDSQSLPGGQVGELTGFTPLPGKKTGKPVAIVHDLPWPVQTTDGLAGFLWLAFANPEVLRPPATNRLPAVHWGNYRWQRESPWFQTAQWSFRAETPFPADLFYWSDGLRRVPQLNGPTLETREPRPFDQGFTNAHYRVTDWQRLQGQPYPWRAIWQVFGVRTAGKSNELAVIKEVRLETKRFLPHCPEPLLQRGLDPGTPIVDKRFILPPKPPKVATLVTNPANSTQVRTAAVVSAIRPVGYVAQSSGWPARERGQAEFEKQKVRSTWSGWIFGGLVTSAAFAGMWWQWMRRGEM